MSEIRLLFASLPSMLSEIVRTAVAAEPDLRVMAEARTLGELGEAARRTRPHVIVVAAPEAELPVECARLMYERPHPRTMSISPDGRRTSLYRLLPQGVRMENVSAQGVVGALRELGESLPYLED